MILEVWDYRMLLWTSIMGQVEIKTWPSLQVIKYKLTFDPMKSIMGTQGLELGLGMIKYTHW